MQDGWDGSSAFRVSMHHRDPRVAARQRAVHAVHCLVRRGSLHHKEHSGAVSRTRHEALLESLCLLILRAFKGAMQDAVGPACTKTSSNPCGRVLYSNAWGHIRKAHLVAAQTREHAAAPAVCRAGTLARCAGWPPERVLIGMLLYLHGGAAWLGTPQALQAMRPSSHA